MNILISDVELRNRVAYTKERAFTKRDGTEGKVPSRAYFTVDYKNDQGAIVSAMVYLDDKKVVELDNKIKALADHSKLNLKCSYEPGFDGQCRLICNDVNLAATK